MIVDKNIAPKRSTWIIETKGGVSRWKSIKKVIEISQTPYRGVHSSSNLIKSKEAECPSALRNRP